jgi:hypothetical protein
MEVDMQDGRKEWICSTVDIEGGALVSKISRASTFLGMADTNKIWEKGRVLNIKFLQGVPPLHEAVMRAARSWLIGDVQLEFKMVGASEAADIRIAFEPGAGSWSFIGTDCLKVLHDKPTMNLGWATLETPEQDFTSVVIHEFGHALGLLHEHNHPGARIEWNQAAVYADLQGPPNRWSQETIKTNVFAKFNPSSVIVTDFDEVSVMIYPVPSRWTTDGRSFMPSSTLSKVDKKTVRRLYA